ncbi:MAG: NADPH-dependent F420 reductase [Rhodoglobus sp.]
MTTLGIIGAGNIGSQVARKAIENGYDVVIANSRGPETLNGLVTELGPRARASTVADAAASGDVVVVTVPLRAYTTIPVEPLAGKIVLDTNNYYPQRDGNIAALDDKADTSSGLLQKHLPTSRVVKAFNHIRSAEITSDAKAKGSENRRALALAGDDADAVAFVEKLYDEFGFDGVVVGGLADSWRVETNQPAYAVRQTADELRANLAIATR